MIQNSENGSTLLNQPKRNLEQVTSANQVLVGQLEKMADAINYLERDELTGLLSKQAFVYYTQRLFQETPGQEYALIMTDIDQFTFVNAIYGEVMADHLLRHQACQMKQYAKNALCGRYGADRLVCLMPSEAVTRKWVEALISSLQKDAPISDVVVHCGVYQPVDRTVSVGRCLDRTVFALKSVKPSLEKLIAYYDGPVSQRHLREIGYALRFPEALRKEEFEIWYQPKFDPYEEKMVGAEALVRWRNQDGSYNMPGEFLSVFEANGMIRTLDEQVFRQVCAQQRAWKNRGMPIVPISVNLSRNSMHQSDLVERYRRIAEGYKISPGYLPIEITESTATGSEQIQLAARQLARCGFPIHMDDCGSEHSSFYTLNLLTFDTVKLDKGLIDFIGDERGETILRYTLLMMGKLGIKTVAEGVENRQQVEFLKEVGCNQIQGYYYSRVLSCEQFEELLPPSQEGTTDLQ